MPRGVYPRKKKPRKKYLGTYHNVPIFNDPSLEEKERTDSKKHMLIQQLISSIQNQLNLLREITNG